MNNLGALCWFKGVNKQDWRHDQIFNSDPMTISSDSFRIDSRPGYDKHTKEALEYWDDAILSLRRPNLEKTSMCAPVPPIDADKRGDGKSFSAESDVLQLRLSDVSAACNFYRNSFRNSHLTLPSTG